MGLQEIHKPLIQSIMNKKTIMKPVPAPSPEEIAANHFRAYNQQMQSIAQAILYNMLHGAADKVSPTQANAMVDLSLEMAAHYMHAAGPAVEQAFKEQMALAEAEANKKEEAEKAE